MNVSFCSYEFIIADKTTNMQMISTEIAWDGETMNVHAFSVCVETCVWWVTVCSVYLCKTGLGPRWHKANLKLHLGNAICFH